MTAMFESPIPLSDIEEVLAWVDTFKLTRVTKKINRDFSDAVLLAEILMVHYPKLVEMHNYPPRNSHALKLNNWMTLNRKVLKKLKLNLCSNTMEQLANSAPGVIERVLIMVRDKIRRDAEASKEAKENEQNLSSGGEYFEAGGDDDQVLVVPLKMRVNGVLETIQQRVVSHESYLGLKEELRDAKETADVFKQRVEHLDNLLKLKDERIEELQKQLDRKATRRQELEAHCNVDSSHPTIKSSDIMVPLKAPSNRSIESTKLFYSNPITPVESPTISASKMEQPKESEAKMDLQSNLSTDKMVMQTKVSALRIEVQPKVVPSNPEVNAAEHNIDLERVRSDVFQEAEVVEEKHKTDVIEFKDTIHDIQKNGPTVKEVIDITNQHSYGLNDMERLRHLDNLKRLKEEKQKELKKLIERKGTLCNVIMTDSLGKPSEALLSKVPSTEPTNITPKISNTKIMAKSEDLSKIPVPRKSSTSLIEVQPKTSGSKMEMQPKTSSSKLQMQSKLSASKIEIYPKLSAEKIVIQKPISATRIEVKPKVVPSAETNAEDEEIDELDRVRSDVFKEAELTEDTFDPKFDENKERIQMVSSIGRTIEQEIIDITNHLGFKDVSYVN